MDQNLALWIAVVVLSVTLAYRMVTGRKRSWRGKKKKLPGVDRLLRNGKYGRAAQLALDHDRPEEAIDYFVRAQKPARAAQIAVQIGNHRRAAELYEHASLFDKAAQSYDKAGFVELARAARTRAGSGATNEPVARSDDLRSLDLRSSDLDSVDVPSDAGDVSRRQDEGRQLAERLLASGDIRGAADTYRDAQLYEESVHLYVNVLALPNEAAPLVAKRGNFERAAELYELGGNRERAAETWIMVARRSKSPMQYVDRICELSRETGYTFLSELTDSHPLGPATAAMHLRYAEILEKRGEVPRAIAVLTSIVDVLGDYQDARDRLSSLTGARPRETLARATSASRPLDDVMLPPVELDGELLAPEELSAIHREAAEIAQRELHALRADDAGSVLERTRASGSRSRAPVPPPRNTVIHVPTLVLLADSAVQAAKAGPSVDTLKRYVDGQECTLRNIEVFYRIGLAHLAGGNYAEALSALEKVDGVSPGYRDAVARVEEIRGWQRGLCEQVTDLGVAGTMVRKKEKSRYTIAGELGRGGMAIVYRATDEVLGRDVALKFLSESSVAQPSIRELFQREARSVAQLNHPNVVTIYDFGTLEGQTFIAMEYVEGVTVKEICQRRSPLSLLETLRISTQLLDALEVAHKRSIIHRDIKPSNMMRTPTGLVKLMDFGLAKSTSQGTDASMVAGTPGYMAPEQILGDKVDARSDIFSVAVSIYEMLAGKLPFEGMDRLRRPAPLKELNANIPRLVGDLVTRGLAFDPDDRFQSAASFAAPFKRILATVGDRATGDLESEDLPQIEMVRMPAFPTAERTRPPETQPISAEEAGVELVPADPPKREKSQRDTAYFSTRRRPR